MRYSRGKSRKGARKGNLRGFGSLWKSIFKKAVGKNRKSKKNGWGFW